MTTVNVFSRYSLVALPHYHTFSIISIIKTEILINMKKTTFLLLTTLLLLSCKSDKEYPYEYWSQLVDEKHKEIVALTESVTCTDIEEFETIPFGADMAPQYYLRHFSIELAFDKLLAELDHLQSERILAAAREGIYSAMWMPNPPIRKACQDGKAKLIFAQDLSLEEVNEELSIRYEEIKNFYNDVSCTDSEEWSVGLLRRLECCYEPIAKHKRIASIEINEKIGIYNHIMNRKHQLENTSCI